MAKWQSLDSSLGAKRRSTYSTSECACERCVLALALALALAPALALSSSCICRTCRRSEDAVAMPLSQRPQRI